MTRLAPIVAGLAILVFVVTLVVSGGAAILAAIAIPFAAVGGLLASQRPKNPIGWLFLGFGVVATVFLVADACARTQLARHPGSLSGDVAAAVAAHVWHAGFGLLVFAFLLFPNGHLLSPRWRWLARVAAVVYGGLAVSGPFDGDFLREEYPSAHPLVGGVAGRIGSEVFVALLMINLLVLMLAAVSLVVRLRRAHGDERQQVKWFVFPVAVTMVVFPVSVLAAGDGRYGIFLFPLIPAAAAVAILRYRLYDIDIVINRALVYTALTVTLLTAYLGTVLLAELVLPASSDLAVAASTLVAAAVFAPARGWIQAAVDRRFFRRRYDAERTLTAFGARLRDEVDLHALGDDLRGVVADAVQPAHVSIWLRER